MNSANEDSRTARRDPKSQSKQTAGARDGTAGTQQNRRGGKVSQNVNRQQETATTSPVSTPQAPPQEVHVPMNGFNAGAVLAMLKSGVDAKVPVYKPEGKDATAKGSPWGTKPGAMANGKDFWLELRKQTTTLLNNGGERRGG